MLENFIFVLVDVRQNCQDTYQSIFESVFVLLEVTNYCKIDMTPTMAFSILIAFICRSFNILHKEQWHMFDESLSI